jgi:hypothetical protein
MRDIAIRNTHPSVTTIIGDTEAWDKDGNVVILDEALITAEVTRLQAEYDAQDYARSRASEYPPATDYLDGIVKGDTAQVDKYIADCLAVKTKYPKE